MSKPCEGRRRAVVGDAYYTRWLDSVGGSENRYRPLFGDHATGFRIAAGRTETT